MPKNSYSAKSVSKHSIWADIKQSEKPGRITSQPSVSTIYIFLDGIIYMVDAADKVRFEESKAELDSIMQTPELAKVNSNISNIK
jgi:hypothetical protein